MVNIVPLLLAVLPSLLALTLGTWSVPVLTVPLMAGIVVALLDRALMPRVRYGAGAPVLILLMGAIWFGALGWAVAAAIP